MQLRKLNVISFFPRSITKVTSLLSQLHLTRIHESYYFLLPTSHAAETKSSTFHEYLHISFNKTISIHKTTQADRSSKTLRPAAVLISSSLTLIKCTASIQELLFFPVRTGPHTPRRSRRPRFQQYSRSAPDCRVLYPLSIPESL